MSPLKTPVRPAPIDIFAASAALLIAGCSTYSFPVKDTGKTAGLPAAKTAASSSAIKSKTSPSAKAALSASEYVFSVAKNGKSQVSYHKRKFIWPANGKIISSFGENKNNTRNKGIDIQLILDSAVKAARSGVVAFVDNNFYGWGKTLIIDHRDGLQSVYCGLSAIGINLGDSVKQGEVIAQVSVSGKSPRALHFEIRRGHIPENPLIYLS